MPIHCLNLLLMYRLKEGTLSQIDYPSSEVVLCWKQTNSTN
ncbi:unnamed protein product [Ascophyllum nodosum]